MTTPPFEKNGYWHGHIHYLNPSDETLPFTKGMWLESNVEEEVFYKVVFFRFLPLLSHLKL
jgi:hypothetical protein